MRALTTLIWVAVGSQWQRWSSTRNIMLPSGTSTGGPAGTAGVTAAGNAYVYAGYIARGYFSIVALNFTDITALDRAITADLRRNHHYRIVQVIPYGTEVPPSAWAPTSSGNTSPAPDRVTAREPEFSEVGCDLGRVYAEHRCAGKPGRCVF